MSDTSSPRDSSFRRNLARELLLALRSDIISGKLQPGQPLAEPSLARQFGSSRAPVREALIELEREGLVQFEATGRTKVRTLSEKDFEEIRDARIALETMAARQASARWTPEDTAFVQENIAQQAKASTLAELSRLDIDLHDYVMRLSGNKRLLMLWQSVRWQFEMCLASTHRLQQKLAFTPRQITLPRIVSS
jgi:DNA-binding GntR family transcriptional regulator